MSDPLSRAILALGHRYRQAGLFYHATDLYLRVLQRSPHTPEGREASHGLLEIARRHEVSGRRYHALSLYAKLALLSPPDGAGWAPRDPRWEVVQDRPSTRTREPVHAIPFVDLTEQRTMTRNFERLGQGHRKQVDIEPTITALTALREA